MNNDIDFENKPRNNGKVLAGVVLLLVGLVLLLHQLNMVLFPFWLFRWPMILIAVGMYSGAKHNFRNSSWFILVLIGVVFTLNDAFPHYDMGRVTWPVLIIIFGFWLILRRNHRWDKKSWDKKDWEGKWDWRNHAAPNPVDPAADASSSSSSSTVPPNKTYPPTGDDYLDATSVFGGVKKTVLSKDFKGGEIVNIFGGAEIDFTQADINGRVILDLTQIFGGTKIIVPSHWQVTSDLAAVFAGVDDKRLRKTGSGDNNKILVLKGVSIFAGVDIRSY
ncbi:MAG: LiaF transmembrane domain-containing protein [Mucilaginibacter sp.]